MDVKHIQAEPGDDFTIVFKAQPFIVVPNQVTGLQATLNIFTGRYRRRDLETNMFSLEIPETEGNRWVEWWISGDDVLMWACPPKISVETKR